MNCCVPNHNSILEELGFIHHLEGCCSVVSSSIKDSTCNCYTILRTLCRTAALRVTAGPVEMSDMKSGLPPRGPLPSEPFLQNQNKTDTKSPEKQLCNVYEVVLKNGYLTKCKSDVKMNGEWTNLLQR
ncbi:hypothetical protein IRJ41_002955 [Triplophysa rosa]|uniref:Uncharacterized protein n=1 Tax=Triplophysa rosa TaxID=992332 RepID=A0A9W7WYG8_TRIRA|nr:hypothetical protein IRJ41_002955 [Triplophysa rosa]